MINTVVAAIVGFIVMYLLAWNIERGEKKK